MEAIGLDVGIPGLPLAALVLVLARAGGLAVTAPGWSQAGLGWRLRLGLAASLAVVVAPLVLPVIEPPGTAVGLAFAAAIELAVGVAMGLAMNLIVAAARQAGDLVGIQAGLSPASLLAPDAADAGELNPMGHLYGLIALAAFLALQGPLRVVDALIGSYRVIPAGATRLGPDVATLAVDHLGAALGLALRAAAPAALALVLAGLALGLIGRAASALQILTITLPARWLLGLAAVLIGLSTAAGVLSQAWLDGLETLLSP